MPNPNRPQYQDTIEETWGDAVADTVVRRYANTADRDADLAGFTPAELGGQVVAIVPGAGVLPYCQQHDGAGWRSMVGPCYGYAEKNTDQVMGNLPGNVTGLELPQFTLTAPRRVTVSSSMQVVKAADTSAHCSIRIVDGATVVVGRSVYLTGGTNGILTVERELVLGPGTHDLYPQVWADSGGLSVVGAQWACMRALGAADAAPGTTQVLPAPEPPRREPKEGTT
jgi:hypothetical protein